MRELKIGKNDADGRLDGFLFKTFELPPSMIYRYIRLKRIKLNGKRAEISTRLSEGDALQLYVNDELLDLKREASEAYLSAKGDITAVYEDGNILIVHKPAGMSVHEDEKGDFNTLIANIQSYLYKKGEWNPGDENQFAPALANRIDRNTEGLVLAAKNAQALRVLNERIRLREIDKTYLAVCVGKVEPSEAVLEDFVFKDEKAKMVYVKKERTRGAKSARMSYRRIAFENGLSLVECRLFTGRTHQIRVQMASAGFPLLGDGKYGDGEQNRQHGVKYQALCSYKVCFEFKEDAGVLEYLRGRDFRAPAPRFAREFFPDC